MNKLILNGAGWWWLQDNPPAFEDELGVGMKESVLEIYPYNYTNRGAYYLWWGPRNRDRPKWKWRAL